MCSAGGIVVFDYSAWLARYPEFTTTTTEETGTGCFTEATLYVANTPTARVPYNPPMDNTRATILNMVTAHIAALYFGTSAQSASALVGRIDSATEGSVTVSADMPAPQSAAWWMQTKYGASAYAAMARFRTAHYRAPRGYVAGYRVPRW